MTLPSQIQVHNGSVYMNGAELNEQQIEQLLTLYETEADAAERIAVQSRKLFNALWDARCKDLDSQPAVSLRAIRPGYWAAVPGEAA